MSNPPVSVRGEHRQEPIAMALCPALAILALHMYCAHINPSTFPIDMTIFIGKITNNRMRGEHPLECAASWRKGGRVKWRGG